MGSVDAIILGMIPFIVAIVELLKKLLKLQGIATIIVSFLVGIGVALTKVPGTIPAWPAAVAIGVLAGGIAAGLWSTAARIVEKY